MPQSKENLTANDLRRRVVTAELRLSIAARVPRAKIPCAGPFRHRWCAIIAVIPAASWC
jgi:hypothetical protein